MTVAFATQAALIVVYLVLTVLFSFQRVTWPMSLYYLGCFVKDSGVLILGWLLVNKGM